MDEQLERIAHEVVDAAVKLHIRVGPGLYESVYETLLAKELQRRGLRVERQKRFSLGLEGTLMAPASLLVLGGFASSCLSVD